jgi:hypothetical protein
MPPNSNNVNSAGLLDFIAMLNMMDRPIF